MHYVDFKNKNWSFAGDKSTWARINADGTITIKRAAKGIVSSAYASELRDYCTDLGVDFDSLKCGESVTVEVK